MILEKVEDPEEQEAIKSRMEERANRERDPLESTEEEDPAVASIKINLKEIDRLYYHVLAIENDCHIVPKGSMKMNVKHELQRNEAYLGLTRETNFDIKSYSHFRQVQDPAKRAVLEEDDTIFSKTFLDEAFNDESTPDGIWSVQTSQCKKYSVIRHNIWRGYTAWSKVNCNDHGSVYVGDGLKNLNFFFMH